MPLNFENIYLIVYLFTYLFASFIYLFHLFCCYRTRVLWNSGKKIMEWFTNSFEKVKWNLLDEITNVFLKDARLLNELRHENVVELLTFCDNSVAIILELCEILMKSFQGDQSFHSLDKFLKYLAKNKLLDFFPGICYKIVNDIMKFIICIHSKNIVHTDIKLANILPNNLYCCNASQKDHLLY